MKYSITTHLCSNTYVLFLPPTDGPPHKPSHRGAQTTNLPEDGKASQAEPSGTRLVGVILS